MGEGAEDEHRARLKELEHQLEESKKRLEETQALARVGSWEWDVPVKQARWSRELLRIFGRDPDGPPPFRDEMLAAIHPEDLPDFKDLVARIESTPGPFAHSYRIVDPEGNIHYMEARGYVESDEDGKPARTFGTTQDITELKESQDQLERAQRFEALGQLAGGVAHDFNNLLSVILNYAEYMIAVSDDPETVKGLREIERAAGSAADLTRQLLLFSRSDANELRAVDLSAVVEETEAMLCRTIGEHVALEVDAPAGLPKVSLASGQAQQILINLAVNARDALPEGGTIKVTVRKLDCRGSKDASGEASASCLLLMVADDGVGMSTEVARNAFDPFFTTKPRGQGTGLGLATVYGIVNQAGGQVEIESEPQVGTTLKVYLPTVEIEEEPAEKSEPSPPSPGEERTVLVVENEKAVRVIVCNMLEKHGYKVRTAASGIEAEQLMEVDGQDIDLVLTDVVMPNMSGRELVKRLRALRPEVGVIYMSGYAADSNSPLGTRWGSGAAVLEKPFTEAQLLRAVAEKLG
jgi:two-component system cell cycle sensor histidine kinase/response regulator CckA